MIISPKQFEEMIWHIDDVHLRTLMVKVHRSWRLIEVWGNVVNRGNDIDELRLVIAESKKAHKELFIEQQKPQNDHRLKDALGKFIYGFWSEIEGMQKHADDSELQQLKMVSPVLRQLLFKPKGIKP